MSYKRTFIVGAVAFTLLSACATTFYSDDRLRADTAGVLGTPPDRVAIQDRRASGMTTYYTAKTDSATYACSTVCGSPIMNFGMSCPPTCNKMEQK